MIRDRVPNVAETRKKSGILTRLLRDKRANSSILIGAAMIPLAGVIGGGIDMGRAYMAKSKLQSACDAGALATRRAMSSNMTDAQVTATGDKYFTTNFNASQYGITNVSHTFTRASDERVAGTATAIVPTTIMRVFSFTTLPITVSCGAVMNLPNADIMFVLDNTGSMAWTNPDDTEPKINILRDAVKTFHASMEAGKSASTQLRYGFVPYSSNVNVGRLLQPDWMVDRWTYQSRVADGTSPSGSGTNYWWRYDEVEFDVSPLKTMDPSASITVPIGNNHTDKTVTWRGCIEERETERATDYSTIPDHALDMNIDLVPDSSDPDTQWRPALPDLVYARDDFNSNWTKSNRRYNYDLPNIGQLASNWSACPAQAQKLAEMDASEVATYVDGLSASGNTYHDIGMVWGARLLSATGLFASENTSAPNGGPIMRHLVFMTDGETATDPRVYDAYGWPAVDRRRVMDPNMSPDRIDQNNLVESRLAALCSAIKAKNITIWVVAFGTSLTSNLSTCATSTEHAFQADNATELGSAFTEISSSIANLRLNL